VPASRTDRWRRQSAGIISQQVALVAVEAGEEIGWPVMRWWVTGFAMMDEPWAKGRIFADE